MKLKLYFNLFILIWTLVSIVIILILLDNKQNYRFSVSIEKFLFFGGRNKILFVKKNRSMEKAIFQDDIFQEKTWILDST